MCVVGGYSAAAKRVCPDAYSFAFDDRASTFVVPALEEAGGWEVRFCPGGRSTDILGVSTPASDGLSGVVGKGRWEGVKERGGAGGGGVGREWVCIWVVVAAVGLLVVL